MDARRKKIRLRPKQAQHAFIIIPANLWWHFHSIPRPRFWKLFLYNILHLRQRIIERLFTTVERSHFGDFHFRFFGGFVLYVRL